MSNYGAEAFPKINTGADLADLLAPPSANVLSGNNYQDMTSSNVSPLVDLKETFIEMAYDIKSIARNTYETNELIRPTAAEQRAKAIEGAETDAPPKPEDDSGPSFLDRLKGLNPFKSGIGTFGKVILALAGLLGLKLFGPQIQGGLASLLTAIADSNLGEKIKDITELIKTKVVKGFEKLKTGTESFIENVQYIAGFIGSIAKSANDYFMQFDTQGAGPGGMDPDGKLDEFEMKALTDDMTTKLRDSIFGFTDNLVATIIKAFSIYAVGSIALKTLAGRGLVLGASSLALGVTSIGAGTLALGIAALGVIAAAGFFKLVDNVATAYEDAITDELGNQQEFSYSEFFTRLLVGEKSGNKIVDVINNAYDKMLIGAGTGSIIGAVSGAGFFSLPGAALGAIIGGLTGIVVGALSAYFGDEAVKQAGEDLKKGFEEGPTGLLIKGILRMYNELILKPFEFIFGKLGIEGDSIFMQGLKKMGYQTDREGPFTKEDLYPDAFNLENKTTEELLAQKNAAMTELSKQPQTKPILGFQLFGKYQDNPITRNLELQIDNIDKILEGRGSSDVNSQSDLPFLQMGKIEPILAPLINMNNELKDQLAKQNLAKELDSMIVGSGNVNTSNISNVNNFPGGFKPDNDFITAVIMGDKRAKMA